MVASFASVASPLPEAAIIGRGREQAVLRRHLAGLLAGQGSLVWVAGETGIGKMTLVDWLANEARRQGGPWSPGIATT